MKMTAEEFDKRFDDGEDVFDLMENPQTISFQEFRKAFLDKDRENQEQVLLSFPKDLIKTLDTKVKEIGVNREAFIKMIVAERLGVVGKD